MRSRRGVDPGPRGRDEFDDEEERLPVPAGPPRVVLGVVTLVSGFLLGAFAGDGRRALVGVVVMLLAPVIMLSWPKR